MKIGIDIDGVLANFMSALSIPMNKKYGCKIYDSYSQIQEYYIDNNFPGYSQEAENLFMELFSDKTFWENIPPIPFDDEWKILQKFVEKNEVYFITDRGNDNPEINENIKKQTEHWLVKYGINNPIVIITAGKTKAYYANELSLEAFIDDKPSNILALHEANPKIKLFIMSWNYCKNLVAPNVVEVNGITGMIYYLDNIENWRKEYSDFIKKPNYKLKTKLARFMDNIAFFFYKIPVVKIPFIKWKKTETSYGAYFSFEENEYHPDIHVPNKMETKDIYMYEIFPEWLYEFCMNISEFIQQKIVERLNPYYYHCHDCNEQKCDQCNYFISNIYMPRINRFPNKEDLQEIKIYLKHNYPELYKTWDSLPFGAQHDLWHIYENHLYECYGKKVYTQGKVDTKRMIDFRIWEGYEYCKEQLTKEHTGEKLKQIKDYIKLYEDIIKEKTEEMIKKYG